MFKKKPGEERSIDMLMGKYRPDTMEDFRKRLGRAKAMLPAEDDMQEILDLALVSAELGYEYGQKEA